MARPAFFRTIEQRQELAGLLESGMPRKDIASEFGCDVTVLRREIMRGTPERSVKGRYNPELAHARYMGFSEETKVFDTPRKRRMLAGCLKSGMSFDVIAKLFGCTPLTVRETVIREAIRSCEMDD